MSTSFFIRQHSPWEKVANWAGLLVLLSLAFAWPDAFSMQPDDAQSGSLFLKSSADTLAIEALHVHTSFRAQVTGNVARVFVSQEFANPGDDWVEGLYVFPLSTSSAVDELLMHVGDRVIRGDIQKRAAARAVYEKALSEGRQASLVDQERPNMFTTSVANIAPHSSITVEIAYLESIALRDGRYTLHLPLAITPRYHPGLGRAAGDPSAAAISRLANTVYGIDSTPERVTSAQSQIDIDIELAPGFALQSVSSLHHQVTNTADSLGRHIKLSGSQVPADRDFELVWVPASVPEVNAAVFAERAGSETYALLLLTPPAQDDAAPEPREVQFIIDTSGSMEGPSIEQAREALQMGIERLKPHDRFNIIRFSSDASSLFESPQSVTPATRSMASRFITSLRASGGTEMQLPLQLAFAGAPTTGLLRQIVFITDGSVGNEAQIVELIRSNIADRRLFTVGIGGSPNAFFLQEAALAGRGSSTLIAERDQVRARMEDLFRKIENPALVSLSLLWPGEVTADLAASLPSDVYSGDPLVVLARLPDTPARNQVLTLTGRIHGARWVRQIPLTSVTDRAGISKLWARERIASLARQRRSGGNADELEQGMVALALKHHLVSELTSLIAVDDTPVRPVGAAGHSEQAPTSAPRGSYWARTTGFAKTATVAPLTLWLGIALAGVALILYVGDRRRFR